VDAGATLPLSSYAALQASGTATAELSPFYLDWLRHPSYDDYWKSWNFDAQADKYQVPAYHVGGWYDLFTRATLRNYLSMKSRAANENARRHQRLLMGPWQHGGLWRKVGDTDFGPSAEVDETDFGLRWYDHLLKGASNGLEREKPVKIFVMGKNIWREEDDWPLARARSTRYFLHSGGKANSLNGNGALSQEAAQYEPADRYMYDPAHPVPTRGGGLCCSAHDPGGAFDQREIEARNDVLVFTTPPFKKDVELTGPLSAELWVQSSAVDTDFTAKLVDVFPDGRAQNLTDGIVRMRYRESMESPKSMAPGEIYKVIIDLAATSNVFFAGHSLRLEVSSSNFPRFDRNLNTGEDQGSSTATAKATNTIYHDREHRSALIVPVIPE
jgi:putative CocE/NonD family hydrolase